MKTLGYINIQLPYCPVCRAARLQISSTTIRFIYESPAVSVTG